MGPCCTHHGGSSGGGADEVILGQWRDRFPRVTLTLAGAEGPLDVEFVVDTGFDGELALPASLVRRLDARILETRTVELAGGFQERCYSYELALEWDGEARYVELLALNGRPLIGNDLWRDHSLQAENLVGGEVVIEPL